MTATMTPAATPSTAPARPARLFGHFLAGLAGVQLLNVACAAVITWLHLTPAGFGVNLLYSVLIGTLAYSFINGGRILAWGRGRQPPLLPFLVLMLAGLALAQWLGSALAGWISGTGAQFQQLMAKKSTPEVLVLTLIAGIIGSWFFWNRSTIAQLAAAAETEKARAAANEKQALEAQLQLLQAQIEPHMLFNTLANLQGLIALDPPRAQQLLDQLIVYLRATLSSSRAQQTTLGQEFSLMQAYLGLMQVRMGSRLRFELDLPPALADTAIAPNLLQPLVENALKHGLEPAVEGGNVRVTAHRRDDCLVLEVEDDGLGLQQHPQTPGTGLGLSNIRQRVTALYGERARLDLLPRQPQGTLARLTLPLP